MSSSLQYVWLGSEEPLPASVIPPAALARAGRTLQQHRLAFTFAATLGLRPWEVRRRWARLCEGERAAWRLRAIAASKPADAALFADMPALKDAGDGQLLLPLDCSPPLPDAWYRASRYRKYRRSYAPTAFRDAMMHAAIAANPGAEVYNAVYSLWAGLSEDAMLEWELLSAKGIK